MMVCEDDGDCYNVKNATVLATLQEAFTAGTPFSAFLLALEICLCLMFFASIPNTRKDPIFCFLAIVFAPYLVKTSVEVAYFIAIYFYTSSYTFWSWVHDSVVSFCYSSFLFNFQYGLFLYSWQIIYAVVKKKHVSKSATRWPYILIFFITLVQAALFWQLMIVGLVSALLILPLASICILTILVVALFCKADGNIGKSKMFWNIPCLLLTMTDVFSDLYLNFRPNAYKTTAVRNKEYLFSVLYPAVAILLMYLTLPALRHAVFPCCYNSDEDNKSDRVFLLTRGSSASGSPAPSEQSNVNTITHQPIISYPNNSVVPYNPQAQQFQTFPVPNVYPQVFPQGYPQASSQNFPQHYPHNYPQGQPIYFPIPITFYNPSHVPNRSNELPVVQ
ncbi:unnamed protein product [Caenorhabditis brenneri]